MFNRRRRPKKIYSFFNEFGRKCPTMPHVPREGVLDGHVQPRMFPLGGFKRLWSPACSQGGFRRRIWHSLLGHHVFFIPLEIHSCKFTLRAKLQINISPFIIDNKNTIAVPAGGKLQGKAVANARKLVAYK